MVHYPGVRTSRSTQREPFKIAGQANSGYWNNCAAWCSKCETERRVVEVLTANQSLPVRKSSIPIDTATVWMLNHRQVYMTDWYWMHCQQGQSSCPEPGWLALLWEFKCNKCKKEKRNDGGKYVLYQPNIVSRVAIKTICRPLCSCHPLIIIKLSTWVSFVDQMLNAHIFSMCIFFELAHLLIMACCKLPLIVAFYQCDLHQTSFSFSFALYDTCSFLLMEAAMGWAPCSFHRCYPRHFLCNSPCK